MYRHTVRDFDLSSFLSKRWNRITWLKRNDHTSIMHCMSHNRSHSSTLSRESMDIHSYYLDIREEFDPMLYFCPSWSDSILEVYWFFNNYRILLFVTIAIPPINLFSSLWVLVSIRLVPTVHMLWYEYTTPICYVWMMRLHLYKVNSNRFIGGSHWRASSKNWTYEFASYELGVLTI